MQVLDRRTASNDVVVEEKKPVVDGYSTFENEQYEKPVPIFNHILVKLDEQAEDEIIGGIYTPKNAQKAPNEGVVVAIADFAIINGLTQPLSNHIKVGDRVRVSRVKKEFVEINGTEYGLYNLVDVKFVSRKKAA